MEQIEEPKDIEMKETEEASTENKENEKITNQEEKIQDPPQPMNVENNGDAPINDGKNIVFKAKVVNEFLICSLCMGYFKDATTVIECLHTFCKSCIYKYFLNEGNNECPRCGLILPGKQPIASLRFDRSLQNIVDKIFPHLEEQDSEKEIQFYKEKGIQVPEKKNTEEENESHETKKLKKEDASKKIYTDEMSFELICDKENLKEDSQLKDLDKPFVRTSAKITIFHLKKFLEQKLGLTSPSGIEITYRGSNLGNEHSLEYILKSRGLESTKNPIFKYRDCIDTF